LGEKCGGEGGRGGFPVVGLGAGFIGDGVVSAVFGANSQEAGGGFVAERDAGFFGIAVGDFGEGGGESVVEGVFEIGIEGGEGVVGGLCGGGAG
jgi:hypothetical protein